MPHNSSMNYTVRYECTNRQSSIELLAFWLGFAFRLDLFSRNRFKYEG